MKPQTSTLWHITVYDLHGTIEQIERLETAKRCRNMVKTMRQCYPPGDYNIVVEVHHNKVIDVTAEFLKSKREKRNKSQ